MIIYQISDISDCLYKIAYRNKYDLMSNKIVKDIFYKIIKENKTTFRIEDQDVAIKVEVEKSSQKSVGEQYDNFTIKADSVPVNYPKYAEISIYITIKKDFSPKDYESFNFVMYEVLRHEIEHAHQFSIDKTPDESYKDKYDKVFQGFKDNLKNLKDHIINVSKYITSNEEIESYARSIIYVAKKQKKSPDDVIKQIFNRAFFHNRTEMGQIAFNDPQMSQVIESTRKLLKSKISELYPKFTWNETWL